VATCSTSHIAETRLPTEQRSRNGDRIEPIRFRAQPALLREGMHLRWM